MPAAAIAAPIAGVALSAATTGFGVMTGIAALGAAASVVGTLTKTPELSYVGMGLSAVGAIGGVAQNQGMLTGIGLPPAGTEAAAAQPLAGMADMNPAALTATQPTDAATWGATATPPAANPGQAADVSKYVQPTPTDIVQYIAGGRSGGPAIEPVVAQGGGEGGTLGSFDNPAAPKGILNDPSAYPPTPPAAAAPQATKPSFPAPPSTESMIGAPNTGGIEKVGSGAGGSIWDKITGFAEKNPLMVMGAMQALGSFISGATDEVKPAQVEALKARAARDTAETDDIRRRQENARAGIPKAYNRPRGLINAIG